MSDAIGVAALRKLAYKSNLLINFYWRYFIIGQSDMRSTKPDTGKAMCTFSVELVDFDQLSDEQTKNLRENYERKKKALQAQLEDANQSLKGITRALEIIEEKTKARSAIQSVSASFSERAYLS